MAAVHTGELLFETEFRRLMWGSHLGFFAQ